MTGSADEKKATKREEKVGASGLIRRVVHVPLTPEQKAEAEKMLATPCPYCSDPEKYQRELKGKGHLSHTGGIAPIGKFWARDESGGGGGPFGMVKAPTYDHGDYWRITIGSENFIPRFKDFNLEIINFKAPYSARFWASDALLFMLSAAPPDIARHNKFPFSVARLTHKKSPLVVDAHTWFSHGTILTMHHLPRELSSADISAMQEALEFFRPETRGAPKIKRADFWSTVNRLGPEATQTEVAAALKVGESTLRAWLKREGVTWEQVKQEKIHLAG